MSYWQLRDRAQFLGRAEPNTANMRIWLWVYHLGPQSELKCWIFDWKNQKPRFMRGLINEVFRAMLRTGFTTAPLRRGQQLLRCRVLNDTAFLCHVKDKAGAFRLVHAPETANGIPSLRFRPVRGCLAPRRHHRPFCARGCSWSSSLRADPVRFLEEFKDRLAKEQSTTSP
jgi:hypothetical protein